MDATVQTITIIPWPRQGRKRKTRPALGREPASLSSALVSGLASDPQTKIKYFASKRFPGLPVDQAMARYDFDKKGDLVFAGDDGKQYREMSELGGYAQKAGEGVPSIAGAVLGGLAGGPLGAMGGGAAGEGLRKGAATALLGEPKPRLK